MVRRVTASAAPDSDLFASQTWDPQSAVFLTLSASDAGTWTAFMVPSSLAFAFRHSPLVGYIGRKNSASKPLAMKRRPVDSMEAVDYGGTPGPTDPRPSSESRRGQLRCLAGAIEAHRPSVRAGPTPRSTPC